MKYVCDVCGYVYDPEVGDKGEPDNGVAPAHLGRKSPKDWVCPLCGVGRTSSAKKNNEYAKAEKERSFSAFIRPFPLSDTRPAPCRVRGRPPARSG